MSDRRDKHSAEELRRALRQTCSSRSLRLNVNSARSEGMCEKNNFFILLLITLSGWSTLHTNAAQAQMPCAPQISNNPNNQQEVICREVPSLEHLEWPSKTTWRDIKVINEKIKDFTIDDVDRDGLDAVIKLDVSSAGALIVGHRGFNGFRNLQILNISRSQLDVLSDSQFPEDAQLRNLDASWNHLKRIAAEWTAKVVHLKFANFSHNALEMVEAGALESLHELQVLHLDNNELQSLALGECAKLEILTLTDNRIENLTRASFREMPVLKQLILTENPLRHIEERTFERLPSLRALDLSANRLAALSAEVFAGLGHLLHLNLSSNDLEGLSPQQFKHLSKLQVLDISSNSLRELNSTSFYGLWALRKLQAQNNDIAAIKASSFAHLNALDTIDLSSNDIEVVGAEIFGDAVLPRLRKLLLKANSIKRLHPLAFASLPYLQYLSLGFNELSSLDIRMFAPLRQLRKLHLGNNRIEELSADVLDSLSGLSELLIDNNKLSFLPDVNITFPNLSKVSIEGNPWQCPCFRDLTNWLEARRVSYVRSHSPHYRGEKPFCVVTPVDFCVKNIQLVRDHSIVDQYEKASKT